MYPDLVEGSLTRDVSTTAVGRPTVDMTNIFEGPTYYRHKTETARRPFLCSVQYYWVTTIGSAPSGSHAPTVTVPLVLRMM